MVDANEVIGRLYLAVEGLKEDNAQLQGVLQGLKAGVLSVDQIEVMEDGRIIFRPALLPTGEMREDRDGLGAS